MSSILTTIKHTNKHTDKQTFLSRTPFLPTNVHMHSKTNRTRPSNHIYLLIHILHDPPCSTWNTRKIYTSIVQHTIAECAIKQILTVYHCEGWNVLTRFKKRLRYFTNKRMKLDKTYFTELLIHFNLYTNLGIFYSYIISLILKDFSTCFYKLSGFFFNLTFVKIWYPSMIRQVLDPLQTANTTAQAFAVFVLATKMVIV